ncbi:MAG: helix-turn-helix domain-containing protein [Actinobacteria bacterium]|nr:helix-turn-helix domain-containing protein [Actinomycetota bacterium]
MRKEHGMSVRQLSARSGVSATTIARLENLHRMARPQTVGKLAQALEVRAEDLE